METSRVLALILALAMVFSVLAAFPMGVTAASYDDASFFAKLNYAAYPGLAGVKAAVDKGDYNAAKAELLKYYKARHEAGTITGFGITGADEFYGMAVLPMRNILTGPYEFDMWQAEFTVTSSEFETYEIDVTDRIAAELNNGAVSFMLMAGNKQQFPVYVKSKEAGADVAPKLVVNGVEITADNDTYIASGSKDTIYGKTADELVIKEDGSGSDPTGSNTRRAYMNFPLSAVANTDITSAKLVVSAALAADCTTGSKDVLVINIGDTVWSEDTLTWNMISGTIYSYEDAANPTWGASPASPVNSEYHNVTSRFWFGKPMAYEYLSYLADPEGYDASHPYSDTYPGAEFGPKLVELMAAFADQRAYGYTRTLETGERLNRWVDIVDAFLATDVFDDHLDEFVKILSFMWGDCNYLNGLNIADGGPWWSNWRIVANAGFFKAVEFLPEFSAHDAWRSKVEYNVEWTMNALYTDDMSFTEAGPSYNAWCVKLFGDCVKAANMSGNPMSTEFIGKLKLAARNAIESYYPNGFDTNIGDSNYRDQMAYFEILDSAFGGSDSIVHAYVTGDGTNADYLSSAYPSTNSAYLRNSWDPDKAVYVNFTNNPNDGHYHPDSNQVLMYAYGQPLLVDSGRYSYSNSNNIYDELRWSRAHNTIEAVGVGMGKHTESTSANDMKYTGNDVFDFAYSEQHGYSGVSHVRNVLFLREGYAIVSDYVEGSNANQLYTQNWHFMPSANAAVDGKNVATAYYGKPNVLLAGSGGEAAVVTEGAYHSADYGLVASSSYATFGKTGSTVKFETLLYPTNVGETADITVTDLAPDDNSKSVIKIEGDVEGYYYVKNTDASDGEADGIVTDAKMLYVGGNTISMAEGKTIDMENGVQVISSPAVIDSISITRSGNTLEISGENLAPAKSEKSAIKIHAIGVEKVILNGEEVELKTDADGNLISVASTNVAGDIEIDGKYYNITDIGENLVPAPGFDDGNGNFDWGTWESPNGSNGYFKNKCEDWFYKVNRDTNEAVLYQSGSITADDYAVGTRWNDGTLGLCSMANFIPVKAGKTYYVSFDYKHKTGAATGYIQTSFKNNRNDYLSADGAYIPAAATTQWQTAETVITAPEDGYVYFHFRWLGAEGNPGNGPYWYFDNFMVAEAELEEVENEYYVDTTVVVNYVDAEGNELQAPSKAVIVAPNTVYTAEAPDTIKADGGVYLLNAAKSTLTIKTVKGENFATAVYDKTQNSNVTVVYKTTDGEEFDSEEILVPFGETIDEITIPYEKLIINGDKAYIFTEAQGFGGASDGEPKQVTLVYEAFDVEIANIGIARSDSIRNDSGYTGMNSEDGADYTKRLMLDNRWYKRAGVFGVDLDRTDYLKVKVQFHINAKSSTVGPFNVYDVTDVLGKNWSDGQVKNLDLTGKVVATGSVNSINSNYMDFDITDLVNAGSSEFGITTGGDSEYVILDNENTDYPPVVEVVYIKSKTITAIENPADIEVAYAGKVTWPTAVKATVDGKAAELAIDAESITADIDTRTPGTTEVTAKVVVPEHYALGTGVSDEVKFNVTVLEEPEAVPVNPFGDTITAVAGQNEAGIYKFGGEITRTATIDFDLTINEVANTLVAINNSEMMTPSNYFSNSAIFMLVNNGKLVVRNGGGNNDGSNDGGIAVAAGQTYHISIEVDVEAHTFSLKITDSEGTVVHSADGYGFRTNTDVLDSIVIVDNSNKTNACAADNVIIESSSFVPDVALSSVPELRILTNEDGSVGLGLAFTATLTANVNLVSEAGFEYGAYVDKDGDHNYVIENTDLNVEFEQISSDQFRLVIKEIKLPNSVRLYAAKPYVVIGGQKYYGSTVADSLYNVLADSIVNGKGKTVSEARLAAANKILAYVGYGNADKFPGQAEAEAKLFNEDGTLKAEYAALGFSTDSAEGSDVVVLDIESVNIEFVETSIADSEAPGDVSAEFDFIPEI